MFVSYLRQVLGLHLRRHFLGSQLAPIAPHLY